MSAYFIAQIALTDEARYQQYLQGVDAAVARYGGRYLAVDTHPEVLEGAWRGTRVALIEFESRAALRRWYTSPEYQAIVGHRLAAADCVSLLVSSEPPEAGGSREP